MNNLSKEEIAYLELLKNLFIEKRKTNISDDNIIRYVAYLYD
ncbi:hypothetical protein ACQY1Q_13595 [Tenacibaculum sp. TC6]